MNDLKAQFSLLAEGGYLGDSEGEDAYAYLRASSERQVEEGSSFPRQLESIHRAAQREGLRISLDLVLFDDGYTGFEFEHRPALLKLRHELHSNPRARHLVIEDIDRLSRNADWQQGFLLEEFSRHEIQVHFFTHPGSQLERYIRGYIAQEGMNKDIERMRMGNVYKAMDGRVTAKRPRYGYLISDPKDSRYELHPEESRVIRWVYQRLIYEGWTLYQIAKQLNDQGVPTRFRTGFWTASTLYQLVKSTVYKGEFYANRHYQVKTGEFNELGRPKRTNRQRPRSEWIRVEVPSIVSAEEWDQAQEALRRNASRSSRNAKKREWLLTGFLKCAICRVFTFVAILGGTKRSPLRYHGCSSRNSEKARMLGTACYSPYLRADDLERSVWEEIERVIYDPHLILRRLEEREQEERHKNYLDRLATIDGQLAELANAQRKFEAAYRREIYTLDEFEEKMKRLRRDNEELETDKVQIMASLSQLRAVEEQERVVVAALAHLRERVDRARKEKCLENELPFELKRRILSLLVDVIWVDSAESTFTIDGVIRGTFALAVGDRITIDLPVLLDLPDQVAFASSRRWQ